jgi:hypothetical protein
VTPVIGLDVVIREVKESVIEETVQPDNKKLNNKKRTDICLIIPITFVTIYLKNSIIYLYKK